MLSYELLLVYLVAIITLIATPGHVVALVIKNALQNPQNNFKVAFFTICGTNIGSLLLISIRIAVILGTTRISSFALSLLSLLGSCFIFYLGFSSLFALFKASKATNMEQSNNFTNQTKLTPRKCFIQGLFLSLSNPKDILFFIAFFPQFMGITDSMALSIILLAFLWILLDFGLLLALSYFAQKAKLKRFQRLITLFSDLVLCGIGIMGIIYGISHLML